MAIITSRTPLRICALALLTVTATLPAGLPAGQAARQAATTPRPRAIIEAHKQIDGLLSGHPHTAGLGTSALSRSSDPAPGVSVDTGPQIDVLDARTKTAYVTSDDGVVSVVDLRACTPGNTSCGHVAASVAIGPDAAGLDLNQKTGTLYVTSPSAGTITALAVQRCRAGDLSGCSDTHLVASVSPDVPLGIAVNPQTDTVYVGGLNKLMFVIDDRACRANDFSGCGGTPATVPALGGAGPVVDQATNTIYVPENGPDQDGTGRDVLVLDGRHCRAADVTGCNASMARAPVGPAPVTAVLDPSSGTLYVNSLSDNTVSALDVRHCVAADTTGCTQTPGTAAAGLEPNGGMSVVTSTHTLYVGNTGSDTVSALDTRTCRAGRLTTCPSTPPPTVRTGLQPFWLVSDEADGTLLVTNHIDSTLGIVDVRRCSGLRQDGCRRLEPTFQAETNWETVNPAVHTWYGTDFAGTSMHLVDTRSCNARVQTRCTTVDVPQPAGATGIVANPVTHTLYVSDFGGQTVAVLDAATCNATVTRPDCSEVAPRIRVANHPQYMTVNPVTDTLYVGTDRSGSVAVVDGSSCNASVQTGCGTPSGVISVASSVIGLTVDVTTDTLYVPEPGFDGAGDDVLVIDTWSCSGRDTTGCGQTPGRIPTGDTPLAVRIDNGTHTIYIANNGGGDAAGSVTVVDSTTCRGADTSGCGTPVTTVQNVGRGLFDISLDPTTHQVFTSSILHASLSQIDGRRCNAARTSGCRAIDVPTDDFAADLAFDPESHTLYVVHVLHPDVSLVDTRATRN